MNSMAACLLENITRDFATVDGTLRILDGVNLVLRRGEAVSITGPSGSGKSTLLYIMGTLESPTSGKLEIEGKSPLGLSPKELAGFRQQHVGFIFQEHHLLPHCTVWENVLFPLVATNGVNELAEQRAEQLLERVALTHRLKHRPGQLSGGERQRVAFCRALINRPTLVLADEPTGNLDPHTAGIVGELLLTLPETENVALVCVTHSMELAGKFPRHLKLDRGQLTE